MLNYLALFAHISPGYSEAYSQDAFHSIAQFRDPPSVYRPKFRYWLPDASIRSELVNRDIREVKTIGAGGLEFLPFYNYGMGEETFTRLARSDGQPQLDFPDWDLYGFGTPSYVSLFKNSLKAAKEADIVVDYSLGANQGQGVPSVPGTTGLAVQLLMGNATILPREKFSAPVPQPRMPLDVIRSGLQFMHPLEDFGAHNLTAVLAYELLREIENSSSQTRSFFLNESSFIDLSSFVAENGSLQWSPPDASRSWKVFSFWESYTNQRSCDGGPQPTSFLGNGSWTVDHFSKLGASRITDFWDEHFLMDKEISDLMRLVGKYAWEDSMEQLSTLPWTPGLLDRFKASYGYDITSYLPVLFSASNLWAGLVPPYPETFRFDNKTVDALNFYQLDYRKVLNDGYQDYISHFQEWTKSIGTEYSNQPAYNLPLQMSSDIVLIDAPEAESLGFEESLDMYRQFCGPAHLYNKSVISNELGAVRSGAYLLTIPDLLQKIKRSFAGGFTMNVLHGFPTLTKYPNTTWPGYTPFFYQFTEMWNQVQPAWTHMRDALDYVGRNQWALQQGTPKIDLAFYLYASPWRQAVQFNSTNLNNLGFTYEYIGPDNIASDQARILEGGLGAPAYKALIFNSQSIISNDAAEALLDLASNGIPLIFIAFAPDHAYPIADQSKLNATMERVLSGPNVHHLGAIDEIPTLLSALNVKPRVSLNCSSSPVYSVYRSGSDVDYVFFFNDKNEDTECAATISIENITPFQLDAWTGHVTPRTVSYLDNASLLIELSLKANETQLIALRRLSKTSDRCSETAQKFLVTGSEALDLPAWNLTIEDWHSVPDRFAVETEISNHTLNNVPLLPWNQLNSSLQSVSGIGHYTTSFTVPLTKYNTSTTALLKLPLIQHTARIFLNEDWLGPIDPVNPKLLLKNLEAGAEYNLRIDVTTTLLNRVKADSKYIRTMGQIAQPNFANLTFADYGLVGQVTLEWGQITDSS